MPQAQAPTKECWEEYEEQQRQYLTYQERWNSINEELNSSATKQRELAERLHGLPWPSGRIPEACLESLTRSSLISAGAPLAVGYVVWVLGIPLICGGCCWLALVPSLLGPSSLLLGPILMKRTLLVCAVFLVGCAAEPEEPVPDLPLPPPMPALPVVEQPVELPQEAAQLPPANPYALAIQQARGRLPEGRRADQEATVLDTAGPQRDAQPTEDPAPTFRRIFRNTRPLWLKWSEGLRQSHIKTPNIAQVLLGTYQRCRWATATGIQHRRGVARPDHQPGTTRELAHDCPQRCRSVCQDATPLQL